MGPTDLLLHLLSFAAPALALGVLVPLAARLLLPRRRPLLSWWAQMTANATVGVLILVLGLWQFGVDGKMATYAGLVAGIALVQWLGSAAWRA